VLTQRPLPTPAALCFGNNPEPQRGRITLTGSGPERHSLRAMHGERAEAPMSVLKCSSKRSDLLILQGVKSKSRRSHDRLAGGVTWQRNDQ